MKPVVSIPDGLVSAALYGGLSFAGARTWRSREEPGAPAGRSPDL